MLRTSLRRPPSSRFFGTTVPQWDMQSRQQATTSDRPPHTHPPSAEPTPRNQSSSSEKQFSYDTSSWSGRVKIWSELAGTAVQRRADKLTSKASATFTSLGSHLNRVTGYQEIEALKRGVVEQEARMKAARQAAREAKTVYEEAVVQRSKSQREVNDLLQRKSGWTDSDVSRFTSLVRQDHVYEQDELRAKANVTATENAVDREFNELMRSILSRYHEEQMWSDKIRSASTYGSLAALGLNLVVFVLAIVVVEPWKRRRLALTFEKKIEEMSLENAALVEGGMKRLADHFVEHERLLSEMLAQAEQAPILPDGLGKNETDIGNPLTQSPMAPQTLGEREVLLMTGSAVIGGAVVWLIRSLLSRS